MTNNEELLKHQVSAAKMQFQLRMFAVEQAVKVTLQDEAMYAGSTLKLADQIYKFVTTGEVAQGI
jgi:hypothetical protein